MHRGTFVEVGDTAQVIGEPRHPYTRALLDARPQLGPPTTEPEPQTHER
jgi:ABC-type oligopeptide transport system ATPase subunit